MNPEDKIKKLIKESKITTDTRTEERILSDAMEHLEKLKRQNSPTSGPYTWRNIMKNPITKFAAAAIILVAAAISLFNNNNLIPTAYALDDTIEAYNAIRFLHAKAFPIQVSEKWDIEAWIECDEYGKPRRFRYETNRVSSGSQGDQMGPVTIVYDGNGSEAWLPNLNMSFRRLDESVFLNLLQPVTYYFDPKLVIEKLRQQAEQGEIILDVNEPDQKDEPIVLTVTYPAESRSASWKKVFYIDQSTRLVKKEDTFEMRDGQYQHERTIEFLDYNQQIDPKIYSLKEELPENVIWMNLSEEVGLAQNDMTDEEIAAELTQQFLQARIDRDFNKAGQLFFGVPGFMIESLLPINVLKIISVGPVHCDPDPDSNLMICLCKNFGEYGGQYYETDTKLYLGPVSGQPGRWMICKRVCNTKPASDEVIQ